MEQVQMVSRPGLDRSGPSMEQAQKDSGKVTGSIWKPVGKYAPLKGSHETPWENHLDRAVPGKFSAHPP